MLWCCWLGSRKSILGLYMQKLLGFFLPAVNKATVTELKLTTLGCWSWKASVKDSDMPSHSKRVMPLPFRSHSGWEKDKVQWLHQLAGVRKCFQPWKASENYMTIKKNRWWKARNTTWMATCLEQKRIDAEPIQTARQNPRLCVGHRPDVPWGTGYKTQCMKTLDLTNEDAQSGEGKSRYSQLTEFHFGKGHLNNACMYCFFFLKSQADALCCFLQILNLACFPIFRHHLSGSHCHKQRLLSVFKSRLKRLFLFTQAFAEHWSELPPAPLTLQPFGTI